jgi:hypothetical protein
MLSEPLYYFDNKENVDPLTGHVSPASKKSAPGLLPKRKPLANITEEVNRTEAIYISTCKKSFLAPLVTVRLPSRSQQPIENAALASPTTFSSHHQSAGATPSIRQRSGSAQEKPFSKIYR